MKAAAPENRCASQRGHFDLDAGLDAVPHDSVETIVCATEYTPLTPGLDLACAAGLLLPYKFRR